MCYRRSRDGDRVELVQDVLAIGVGQAVVAAGQTLCFLGINIHYGDKIALGKLSVNLGVDRSHFASADHSNSYFFILHVVS